MADTYLPADVRKRIVDVMRERKMTQRELALRIDVNESTISRFLSGKTEKLSEESVIRIARVFNVSTDFILGTTVIPDKKNYDISELGLSVEAAKNLYTGKVNNDVVNRLLENPRFAMVTYMIAQYMDDTLARGYAAQNQMFATVGSLLLGQNQAPEAVQAARTANAMKIPAYQADQTTIQNTFMTVVKEIKKEAGSDLVAAKAISKEATEKMFAELTKGQDMQNPTITPEAVVDAITNEQLCIAAQSGDKWAENALVENNLRFIRKTAYEIWSAQRELNVALGIELNDLVQEGSLGLLGCISSFQPDYGNKFLTYAAPAIHNAMLDYIRRLNPTFEAKNLDCIIRLDEVKKGENK